MRSVGSQEATCRSAVPALPRIFSTAARSTRDLTGSCTSTLARKTRNEHRLISLYLSQNRGTGPLAYISMDMNFDWYNLVTARC